MKVYGLAFTSTHGNETKGGNRVILLNDDKSEATHNILFLQSIYSHSLPLSKGKMKRISMEEIQDDIVKEKFKRAVISETGDTELSIVFGELSMADIDELNKLYIKY